MTVLKMGFAMGGGIALGTFSGAALGETIKLAILRGKDKQGQPFERVEVDVFSGASAGSMSLGLMLRSLVHQTPSQTTSAEAKLTTQFGDEFTHFDNNKKPDLIAAQVLQDLQHDAWVDDVDMKGLLAKNRHEPIGRRLKHTAGILNRAAVDDVARKYFGFDPLVLDTENPFADKRILADRVLYASALSNMTPILNDARDELPTTTGGNAVLADGMTSRTHRELRVFDLHFGDKSDTSFDDDTLHPKRWVRYHMGNEQSGLIGNMTEPAATVWQKMAATAVSSGAFPLAFEPVVLERKRFEYGEALWPQELKDAGKDRANFTYTDGGTFNNEPIREAFRMAAFIDSHDDRPNTERWVVFVDPSVSSTATSFKVPVHQRYTLEDPQFGNLDGYDLEPRHSLDRLIPQIFSIIGAISNQSRALEGDKIYQVSKKFDKRDALRPIIQASLDATPTIGTLDKLKKQIETTLQKNRVLMMVPATPLTIKGELRRIIREIPHLSVLTGLEQALIHALETGDDGFANKALWLEALSYILLDMTMNLAGKNRNAKLISIGPIRNPGAAPPDPIALPGGKLGAFGGFTHKPARHMDTEIGKWCATKFLEAADCIQTRPPEDEPKLTELQETAYQKDLEKGTEDLVNRLFSILTEGHVPFLSAIPKWVFSFFLKSKILKAAAHTPTGTLYEFRIKVPDTNHNKFEWDGPGSVIGDRDIKPVAINGGYYLVSFASLKNDDWDGAHIVTKSTNGGNPAPHLKVDKEGRFLDRKFCHIQMPAAAEIEEAILKGYPTFEMEIVDADKGEIVPSSRWRVNDLAQPLHKDLDIQPTPELPA